MTSQIETITPEIAREMLSCNTSNRNIRKTVVAKYAKDMQDGNWMTTHQGIAFDEEGTLIDGQHRLLAVVLAKVAVPMLVTRGVPKSDKLYVCDTQARRSYSDIAVLTRLEGLHTDKNIPPIVRQIFRNCFSNDRATMEMIHDFIDENYEALAFVKHRMYVFASGACPSVTAGVALLGLHAGEAPEAVEAFLRCVNRNLLCEEYNCQAALSYKDYLNKNKSLSGHASQSLFQYGQAALYSFAHNKQTVQKSKTFYTWTKKEDEKC